MEERRGLDLAYPA